MAEDYPLYDLPYEEFDPTEGSDLDEDFFEDFQPDPEIAPELPPEVDDSTAESAYDSAVDQAAQLPAALRQKVSAVLAAYTFIQQKGSVEEKARQVINFQNGLNGLYFDLMGLPALQQALSVLNQQVDYVQNRLEEEDTETFDRLRHADLERQRLATEVDQAAELRRQRRKAREISLIIQQLEKKKTELLKLPHKERELALINKQLAEMGKQQKELPPETPKPSRKKKPKPVSAPEPPPMALEPREITDEERAFMRKLIAREQEVGKAHKNFESKAESDAAFSLIKDIKRITDDHDRHLVQMIQEQYIGPEEREAATKKPRRLRSDLWTQDMLDEMTGTESKKDEASEEAQKRTEKQWLGHPLWLTFPTKENTQAVLALRTADRLDSVLEPLRQGAIFKEIPGLADDVVESEGALESFPELYEEMLEYFSEVSLRTEAQDLAGAQTNFDKAMDLITELFEFIYENYPEHMAAIMPAHKILVTDAVLDLDVLGGNTAAAQAAEAEIHAGGMGIRGGISREDPEARRKRVREYYKGWAKTQGHPQGTYIPMLGEIRREQKSRKAQELRDKMREKPDWYKRLVEHRRKTYHSSTRDPYWGTTVTREQPRSILVGEGEPPTEEEVDEFLEREETKEMLAKMSPEKQNEFIDDLMSGKRKIIPLDVNLREGIEERKLRMSPEERAQWEQEQKDREERRRKGIAKFTPQADSLARKFSNKPRDRLGESEPLTEEEKAVGMAAHRAIDSMWKRDRKLARIGSPLQKAVENGDLSQVRRLLHQREQYINARIAGKAKELESTMPDAADFVTDEMERAAYDWVIQDGRGGQLRALIEPMLPEGFLDNLGRNKQKLDAKGMSGKDVHEKVRDTLFSVLAPLEEVGEEDIEEVPKAAGRLHKLLVLAEEKTVKREDGSLKLSEDLLDDLIQSLHGTKKCIDSRLDKIDGNIPEKDIEKIRNFTGSTALLCNMILSGKEYSREDRQSAILDLAS
jgi:hypothetical protein